MKIRNDFVTNSSSINFYIVNISDRDLTIKDFFLENRNLFEKVRQGLRDLGNWYNGDLLDYRDNEILDILSDYKIKSRGILHRDVGGERYDDLDFVLYVCETKGGWSKNFIWERDRN